MVLSAFVQGGTAGSAQATRRLTIRLNDIMVGVGVVGRGACRCHNPFLCGCFASIYASQGGPYYACSKHTRSCRIRTLQKKDYDEFFCRESIGNDDLKEPYRISSSGCVWLELVIDSRDSYLY